MGKAEDSASIVVLVSFVAEEGKCVEGLGADKCIWLTHRSDCNQQSACAHLFPFLFGVLYFDLGCWKTVPMSCNPNNKKKRHVFPILTQLTQIPILLSLWYLSCSSSAYYCPVELRVFLSAGGVESLTQNLSL